MDRCSRSSCPRLEIINQAITRISPDQSDHTVHQTPVSREHEISWLPAQASFLVGMQALEIIESIEMLVKIVTRLFDARRGP